MDPHFNLHIQLPAFMKIQQADKNIKPHHVNLYINLLLKWQEQENNPVILVTSQELMDASNIGSRTTYFRSMRELHEWGYINAYHKGGTGAIVVMKFLRFSADR